MLQLVYVSSASAPATTADATAILNVSRVNNKRDGITGMLYSDGVRFLQALEGEPAQVQAAFDRIRQDPRHRAVVVLSRREIDVREFGEWAMAHKLPGGDADLFIERVSLLAANAAPDVRATFEGFAQVRRAA